MPFLANIGHYPNFLDKTLVTFSGFWPFENGVREFGWVHKNSWKFVKIVFQITLNKFQKSCKTYIYMYIYSFLFDQYFIQFGPLRTGGLLNGQNQLSRLFNERRMIARARAHICLEMSRRAKNRPPNKSHIETVFIIYKPN